MATQTGSIDLTATRAVHLAAEAGFESAADTYSTKGELEVTNNAVTLHASEITTLKNGTLSFIPTKHLQGDADFWYTAPSTNWTMLEDGWAHYEITRAADASSTQTYLAPKNWSLVHAGEAYTFIVEVRNFTADKVGTENFAYIQEMAGAQFWGGSVKSATGYQSTSIKYSNLAEGEGTYTKRFVKLADTDHIGPDTTYDGLCFRERIYLQGGHTSFDMRFSVYPGEYDGDYSEYISDSLNERMNSAEASIVVNSDRITSEVAARETLGETVAEHSTAIEQTANNVLIKATENDTTAAQGGQHLIQSLINVAPDGVTIDADKVNITGAAIFTSGRLSQESLDGAYDSKGAADSIQVGGRNLLLNTATSKSYTIEAADSDHSSSYYAESDYGIGITNNDTTNLYTVSYDWETDGVTKGRAWAQVHTSTFSNIVVAEGWHEGADLKYAVDLSQGSGHYRVTFRMTSTQASAASQRVRFRVKGYPSSDESLTAGVKVTFSNVKFEKASKPTDWSPAPEDVDASISSVSTVANNAAPKADAVKRTQRIYYRTSSSEKPTDAATPTTWVTQNGNKWSTTNTSLVNWTTKVTPIAGGTGADVTKCLYLWTCQQYELADGTIGHTEVLLDDSTTVIDGGKIITGSVSANSINASSGTFDTANIPNLSATKITSGDISADRIKANVISAINSLTAGTINGERINAAQLTIGGSSLATQSDVDNLVSIRLTLTRDNWTDADWATREVAGYTGSYTNAHTAKGGASSSTGLASDAMRVGDLILIEGVSTDTGNTHRITVRVTQVPSSATATIRGETVSSISSVEMVDNINVGVRNLLRWTNTRYYAGQWSKETAPADTYGWYVYSTKLTGAVTDDGVKFTHNSTTNRDGIVMYLGEDNAAIGGEDLVLSFDYRTNITTFYTPYLLVAESGNAQHATSMACTASETDWVHGSWKLNFPSTDGKTVMAILFAYTNVANGWLEIKSGTLKLEHGSKATDWTPAQEDVSSSISDASKTATNYISANSSGIKIANANPSASLTYQLQTATGTDFVVAGSVMNRINGDGMMLYDGSGTANANIVAKFASSLIELGKNSIDAAVEFCAGKGRIAYDSATQFLQFTSLRLSNYAKSEDGTTTAASQVAAWFKTGETSGVSTGNMANVLNEANASYASSKVSATRPVEGADQKQAWIEVKATGSDSWVDLVANGIKINSGTSIKAIYMGTAIENLDNGQWLQLKSASQVATLLGSGASQANTICIAQNGDFDTYAGVVTGAMGQDGSARAYIYPNRTGGIRINYMLIRFA